MKKSIYGGIHETPELKEHVRRCVEQGVYDSQILTKYSDEEFEKLDTFIDHQRDFLFTYAGLRQVVDKYLVQDRSTGKVYETPQFMYLLIAMTIFAEYPPENRLVYVKKYYDAISKHRINIPTPIMAGVRTPIRQFASCVLVDIDDTLDSIFSSDMTQANNMSHRGSSESVSTQAESVGSTLKSEAEKFNTQVLYHSSKSLRALSDAALKNGIRGGSATVHFPIWHKKSKTS